MKTNNRSGHPVSSEAIHRAHEVYWKLPWHALTGRPVRLETSNNGLDHRALFKQEGTRVRCTVCFQNYTNMTKWFWLPLKPVELKEVLL